MILNKKKFISKKSSWKKLKSKESDSNLEVKINFIIKKSNSIQKVKRDNKLKNSIQKICIEMIFIWNNSKSKNFNSRSKNFNSRLKNFHPRLKNFHSRSKNLNSRSKNLNSK